jgi:hypothetical protein
MKTNKLAKQIRANKLHFSETLNPKREINSQTPNQKLKKIYI